MKKVLSMIICLMMIISVFSVLPLNVGAVAGIANNGLGGIYIDINAAPYTDGRWYEYGDPYGNSGCTWFVGARVMQLTGKGSYFTQNPSSWYYSYGPSLGFNTVSTPQAPSVICYSGHVAILEKIEGNTAFVSEGGVNQYKHYGNWQNYASGNSYCVIHAIEVGEIASWCGYRNDFLGYLYLGEPDRLPEGWLDSVKVVNNEVTVKGWAYDKDCPNRPIDVHIYVGDECHITTANLDLDPGVTSYTGYSNHCFQTTFTTNKSGSQEVKAYGINVDKNGTPVGTGNAQLNQSFTVNITQITGSNLGDDFYANIITGKNGLAVGADSDDNVRVQTRDGRDNQIWHFQRNSDGTYCITNVGQNKCLDNTGGAWGHPDGIKLFSSSDIDAQRWYVQLTNSGYSFIPKSSKTSAATVSLASFSEGTYIIGRQYKESIAQIFTIDYVGLKPAVTSTYNGHTYELYDITCSWHQAYRTCEQLGGHLVTIASKGENDFVWSLKYSGTKKSDYLWLGATDEINEGTWQWITGESFTYHPWASTQPDNAGSAEHYLEMNADSSWNDLTKYYNPHHPVFICEYDNTSINASAYTPSKTTTYNNKTYEYYNTEVMWSTAKAICEAKGGHLVIINDTSENKAVNDLAKNRVWLGFSDIGTEGRFIDVLGNELTYSNWLSGEPNNYYMCENYAEMYADGTWNDARYAKRGFVCEYELPNYLGDVDGDGSITITDATTIQRYIAEYELPNPDIIQKCGDVDGDGSITVTDATTIQKYIAEYELPYPIGEPVA